MAQNLHGSNLHIVASSGATPHSQHVVSALVCLSSPTMSKRILLHADTGSLTLKYFCRRLGLISRNWERKRFYKDTTVYQTEDDGYGVRLDHRSLRTPLRKVFCVPSQSLAMAVAQEWRTQSSTIEPALMHLTALCNTVIDNPLNKTQEEVISQVTHCLSTDTVCFRSDSDDSLVELQVKEWDPVIGWFNERYHGNLSPTTSLSPVTPSSDLTNALSQYLRQLDMWSLIGFSHSLDSTSSVVLTCALMEGRIDPLKASHLTHLEMRHQISYWGNVEWQHDVEAHDLLSRLSASMLLSRLSKELTNNNV